MSHPRAFILLEMLFALAVFILGAAFTLSVVTNTFDAVERSRERQLATDLAWSKLAELEAGLVHFSDLRRGELIAVGSIELVDLTDPDHDLADSGWSVEVDTRRTEFTGLSMVELTISRGEESGNGLRVTARRLMRLHDERVEEYEEDDLLKDLPARDEGANGSDDGGDQ